MKIDFGRRLLFIGDSITDCGCAPANYPAALDLNAGLGNGYVNLVAAHVAALFPEREIRVINRGVSGNTVRDLAARWKRDVLDLAPDKVSVMIGINDVWRQFTQPLTPEAAVPPEEFARTLDELARQIPGQAPVFMTPFVIEPNREDPMRRRMDEYGAIVRGIAAKRGAIFVDTQAAFDAALKHLPPRALAEDRIHPNTTGHLLLARAFLAAHGVRP